MNVGPGSFLGDTQQRTTLPVVVKLVGVDLEPFPSAT